MNWTEFFAMGGYAFYVWSSYAVAAVVLALNVILPLRRRKRVLRTLREFHRLKGERS
jgi:heme exporter protein D